MKSLKLDKDELCKLFEKYETELEAGLRDAVVDSNIDSPIAGGILESSRIMVTHVRNLVFKFEEHLANTIEERIEYMQVNADLSNIPEDFTGVLTSTMRTSAMFARLCAQKIISDMHNEMINGKNETDFEAFIKSSKFTA
jgi:hypothetical protein